jgi:hypothetical protein
MSLLADVMVKGYLEDTSFDVRPVPKMLHEPVAIKCHQISRAWYRDGLQKKEDSSNLLARLEALPSKPPFDSVWIEWEIPYARKVEEFSAKTFDELDWLPDGAFVLTDPLNGSCWKAFIFAHQGFAETKERRVINRPVLLGMIVAKWEAGNFEERVVQAELTKIGKVCAISAFAETSQEPPESIPDDEFALTYFVRTAAVHTIDLCLKTLHVKNVEIVEQPFKKKKKQKRLRPEQQIRWNTVKVRPAGKKYADCDSSDLPVLTAHHLVRGHFATYTPDKPLFGKFVGTYWREAHARGSKDAGEVAKDYEVFP